MILRIGLLLLATTFTTPAAERILSFESLIEVIPDGDLVVTETIRVQAEGAEIKRGIYRDFPQLYKGKWGLKEKRSFEVLAVKRNGEKEPFDVEEEEVGSRIRIGNPDTKLERGEYTYEIRYRTGRQLILGKQEDELYWNVTGNYWAFPIDEVTARVVLPNGIVPRAVDSYVGKEGSKEPGAHAGEAASVLTFSAGGPLAVGEGLTVVVTWDTGQLYPEAYKRQATVMKDHPLVLGAAGLLFLALAYYVVAWAWVGKDPAKGKIGPRFEPPEGYSPAAVRYLCEMGFDNTCFSAGVMGLAAKRRLKISQKGKEYSLEALEGGEPLSRDEQQLFSNLLSSRRKLGLKQSNHSRISRARKALQKSLSAKLELSHFVRNLRWWFPGLGLALAAVLLMIIGSGMVGVALFMLVWLSGWTVGTTALVSRVVGLWRGGAGFAALGTTLFALPFVGGWFLGAMMFVVLAGPLSSVTFIVAAAVSAVFYHLIKAPTMMGRRVMDEIEGFRDYLELSARSRASLPRRPDETPELFERYLPYALALGVEERWGERFDDVLKAAGRAPGGSRAYVPSFFSGSSGSMVRSLSASALGGALTGALASSSVSPSSSSGGGGGSSGGGGGGGGGGGW